MTPRLPVVCCIVQGASVIHSPGARCHTQTGEGREDREGREEREGRKVN